MKEQPHVALISGRLYGYGPTYWTCHTDFNRQILGGAQAVQFSMRSRVDFVAVSDEHASEVAEMLGADAIRWS